MRARGWVPAGATTSTLIAIGAAVMLLVVMSTLVACAIGRFIDGDVAAGLINLLAAPVITLSLLFPTHVFLQWLRFIYLADTPVKRNRFFAPEPLRLLPSDEWPEVSIMIPVYRESFDAVIRATLDAARRAAQGKARVVVCDDGLLVMADDDLPAAEARIAAKRETGATLNVYEREIASRLAYYREHGLGFVARSREGRAGYFKKASNLETAHVLSDQVTAAAREGLDIQVELRRLVAESPRPLAAEGDIRLGEFMLLLDKDSLVPERAFDAALPEFLEDPKLGFTQHRTVPTNSDETFFSRAIGRFTENLFDIVFYCVTRFGDQPPFVGHNGMLRVSAMRDAARFGRDGVRYWSNRVSEDFDLAMRMNRAGYHGRYLCFPGLDFGEAVTRTFWEEAGRFRKFSYGAFELLFNPIRDWGRRGIFDSDMIAWFRSPTTPFSTRFGTAVYVSTYVCLALAPLVSLVAPVAAMAGVAWSDVRAASDFDPSSAHHALFLLLLFGFLGPLATHALRFSLTPERLTAPRSLVGQEAARDVLCIPITTLFLCHSPCTSCSVPRIGSSPASHTSPPPTPIPCGPWESWRP